MKGRCFFCMGKDGVDCALLTIPDPKGCFAVMYNAGTGNTGGQTPAWLICPECRDKPSAWHQCCILEHLGIEAYGRRKQLGKTVYKAMINKIHEMMLEAQKKI